ncbi:MAG: hypothetical protein ACR2PL_19310, partial [Dehalococcoidia bacterium]
GQIGSGQGSGNGQFLSPSGVAVDRMYNVYVADRGNNRIEKFDSSGAYVMQWGTSGSGPSQFNHPYAVALGSGGDVYVADSGNNRIQKFDSSGAYLAQWGSAGSTPGHFQDPYDLTVDGRGNVYVADSSNNRIQKIDSSGKLLTAWGSFGFGNGQFQGPFGVALSGSSIYVADTFNNRIQKFGLPPPALLTCTGSGPSGASVSGGTTSCSVTTNGPLQPKQCNIGGCAGDLTVQFLSPDYVSVQSCTAKSSLPSSVQTSTTTGTCDFMNSGTTTTIPAGTELGTVVVSIPTFGNGITPGDHLRGNGEWTNPDGSISGHDFGDLDIGGSGATIGSVASPSPSPSPSPSVMPTYRPVAKDCEGPNGFAPRRGQDNTCSVRVNIPGGLPAGGSVQVTLKHNDSIPEMPVHCSASVGQAVSGSVGSTSGVVNTCAFVNTTGATIASDATFQALGWTESFTVSNSTIPGALIPQTQVQCAPSGATSFGAGQCGGAAGQVTAPLDFFPTGSGEFVGLEPAPLPPAPPPCPAGSNVCLNPVTIPVASPASNGSGSLGFGTLQVTAPNGLGNYHITISADPTKVRLPTCVAAPGEACTPTSDHSILLTGTTTLPPPPSGIISLASFVVQYLPGSGSGSSAAAQAVAGAEPSSALAVTVESLSDKNGAPIQPNIVGGTVVQVAPGDANANGTVDAVDALCVLRNVAQLSATQACPAITLQAPSPGNVNNDTQVNAVDALCILRNVAKLGPTPACPQFPTGPVSGAASPSRSPQSSASQSGGSRTALVLSLALNASL